MSQYIHTLKPGENLAFKGPITKIPYKSESRICSTCKDISNGGCYVLANEHDAIGMIAGGSGMYDHFHRL